MPVGGELSGVSLIDGFVRLRKVVVEDDVRLGWDEIGDVGLLNDSTWFPVEWDEADWFKDFTDEH